MIAATTIDSAIITLASIHCVRAFMRLPEHSVLLCFFIIHLPCHFLLAVSAACHALRVLAAGA